MRIAFATCPAWPDGFTDDHEAAALAGAEWRLWDDPTVDWEVYDRVVLRSVWNYTKRIGDFLAWCERVGPERLRNTPELVAFNADKRYLGELGVPIVPTAFVGPDGPPPGFEGEVVVKPNVSAGARDTGRFPAERHDEALALIEAIRSSGRVALVQPYLPGVDEEGETAIVYLDGEVSHVLRKRAILRDAGVAPLGEDPDGPAAVMLDEDLVFAGQATDAELALAADVHERITERFGIPLYARVDIVPGHGGEPVLIELEALDPCLYLDQAPGAAARFGTAITR
jgi:hypothetical protein